MDKLTEDELFADACEDETENPIEYDKETEDFDSDSSEYEDPEGTYTYDEVKNKVYRLGPHPNALGGMNNQTFQPNSNFCQRFQTRICTRFRVVDDISNAVGIAGSKIEKNRLRVRDKADRATVEQVLDARTNVILAKMANMRVFDELQGCVSTGKEANVYYGLCRDGREVAVKIFKTSTMVFKKREKYISGEFRFQQGISKNSRKLIRLWSEKETRNLLRMYQQGLPVPNVYSYRSHVIAMDFIGTDAVAAPKLKDVELSDSEWCRVYRDVVILMWKLHNKCKLVHADLSEYNILFHKNNVVIIDVSQSIESSQRQAFYFLRIDIKNITNFFRRKRVPTMSYIDLFFFLVDINITEKNMEECLDAFAAKYSLRENYRLTPEEEHEENVFLEVQIAKSLAEIVDVELEIAIAKGGLNASADYKAVVGLTKELKIATVPKILEERRKKDKDLDDEETLLENEEIDKCDENGEDSDANSESSSKKSTKFVDSSRPKHETLDEKKARKKAIKEANATRRKQKNLKGQKKVTHKKERVF